MSFIQSLALTLSRIACGVPESIGRPVTAGLGLLTGQVAFRERKRLRETIERVYVRAGKPLPMPMPFILSRLFSHFALNGYELLNMPRMTRDDLEARFEIFGREHFEAALQRKKGVILAVPHLGNWELLGTYLAHHGYPLHSFFLAQKEDDLGSTLDHFRAYSKIVLHDRDRGTMGALKALKRGEVLGMICDQDGGNYGVYLDFLHHWVSLPAGPANWSLKTGAAIIPLYCLRQGLSPRFKAYFGPPLPDESGKDHDENLKARTRKLAAWMESVIQAYPHQYLWFYDRFKPRHEALMAKLKQGGHPMRTRAVAYGHPS